MTKYNLLIGLMLPLVFACDSSRSSLETGKGKVEITVKNPSNAARKDALAIVDAHALAGRYPKLDLSRIKLTAGAPLAFQSDDLDGDGAIDDIVFLIDLAAGEEKTVVIESLAAGEPAPVFKKRTQAELSHKTGGAWQDREYLGGTFGNVSDLRVPPEHTDHSWYIRYEGPGWESDRVGYRFYLDWRNATDIFGKKTTGMVLQDVGQDGFDSYHEPADWGQDILKVGPSLGIGSLGAWVDGKALRVEKTDSIACSIPVNGDVYSLVRTRYYGWQAGEQKTDVISELSISAGSRLTRHEVQLSQSVPLLCTGLVKLENTSLLNDSGTGAWGYLATWGTQSLAEDKLGMAVLFRTKDLVQRTEDEHNQAVVLRPENNRLTYYFLAAWEQEPGGIKTEEAFQKYLEEVLMELNDPLKVTFPGEKE